MSTVFLGLGTNMGDRQGNLRTAIEGISKRLKVTAVSSTYETEPWGILNQARFLNMCVQGVTTLPPNELLVSLKDLEHTMGRTETVRWGPRLIDLDILFYDNLVLQQDNLTIPHPGITDRPFVLVPLAELAPDHIHPVNGLTVVEMLSRVDISSVTKLT